MTPLMRLICLLFTAALAFGCATPGPKYIDLAYTGSPDSAEGPPASVGISRFADARSLGAKGGIGHRTLNDSSKEIFLVRGLDLAVTLTDATQTFLERKGFKVNQAAKWSPTLEGLSAAPARTDYLLTARINTFQCIASKKGAVTEMALEVDLDFFLGQPAGKTLTTIPVNLTLTRKDINFTQNKLESFFNDALAEALEKALTFARQ